LQTKVNALCGTSVEIDEIFLNNSQRHGGLSSDLVVEAIETKMKITRPKDKFVYSEHVLFDYFIGHQGLIYNEDPVGLDQEIHFGIRKGRKAPTPIKIGSEGYPTNFLFICLNKINGQWTLTKSYPSSGPDFPYPGPEPISYKTSFLKSRDHDLATYNKLQALQNWRHFSIAEYTTDFEQPLFCSTWKDVMTTFWSTFDTKD